MSTNQQIIDRALREIGVVEGGSSADATDSADTLTDLNGMMAQWRKSSMDLDFFPQDDLTATCPVPDWAEEAVVSNLAVKAAVTFRANVTQALGMKAHDGKNLVGRTLINLNLEQADMTHMPQGEGQYGRSILTDS